MTDKQIEKLKKMIIGQILINEPMKKHTTFGIGGPASAYIYPKDKQELISILKIANRENIPVFFTGSGTNLLVSDNGFDGIVISLSKTFGFLKNFKCGPISALFQWANLGPINNLFSNLASVS